MLRALARPSTKLALAGGGACLASYSLLERSRCAGSVAPGLDPKAFKPLTLTKITPLTADTAIYRFAYGTRDAMVTALLSEFNVMNTPGQFFSTGSEGKMCDYLRFFEGFRI